MPLLTTHDEIADSAERLRGGVVSIGNFDGVHLGHRAIAAALVDHARDANIPAIVLTFDPHPIRLLRPEAEPPALATIERRAELLGTVGVDVVVAYPTDRDLLAMTPRAFFDEIVLGRFNASGLVEGPNFEFGRNRAGNVDTLRTFCEEAGLSFEVVDPVHVGGEVVSSSRIRTSVVAGEVAAAAELLGTPYCITGVVVRGAGRGRTLGTPTANLDHIATLVPAAGVYAARAVVPNGERFPAAVNIGPNPTFGDDAVKVEAHLVGFDGDLYDRPLHLEFLQRLRGVRSFADREELESAIAEDVRRTVEIAE